MSGDRRLVNVVAVLEEVFGQSPHLMGFGAETVKNHDGTQDGFVGRMKAAVGVCANAAIGAGIDALNVGGDRLLGLLDLGGTGGDAGRSQGCCHDFL